MNEIDDFGIVILVAGIFCLSAVLISFFVTKLKNDINKAGKYECGFVNFDKITFIDNKLYIVPHFIVLEMMGLWLLFYLISSILMHIAIQPTCFYLFLITFVMCSSYSEKTQI